MFSRSFATPVTTRTEMATVLSIYAQRAAGRLRGQGSTAKTITCFASTSSFANEPFEAVHGGAVFPVPTDDPILMVKAATEALLPRIRDGAKYVRAGITLSNISTKGADALLDVFVPQFEQRNLGGLLDIIGKRHGANALGLGLAGLKKNPGWSMKRETLSPRATTHWGELATVHAR